MDNVRTIYGFVSDTWLYYPKNLKHVPLYLGDPHCNPYSYPHLVAHPTYRWIHPT